MSKFLSILIGAVVSLMEEVEGKCGEVLEEAGEASTVQTINKSAIHLKKFDITPVRA